MYFSWPITRWTPIWLSDIWDLPDGGGCYALYGDGRLIYIGQSCRIRHRLLSYRFRCAPVDGLVTPWGVFLSVNLKVKMHRRFAEWTMTELRLIRRLKPQFNQVGKKEKARALCTE